MIASTTLITSNDETANVIKSLTRSNPFAFTMLRSGILLRSPLLWKPSNAIFVTAVGKRLQRQPKLVSSQWRCLSEESKTKQKKENETSDSKEIVLTPGEQVVAATRLGMWGGIFAFACVCGYYIVKELMPTYVLFRRLDRLVSHDY